jgi:ribosome-interacting GTPase 1
MPANLPAEWYSIERKYLEAKTIDEKIFWLEKLISATPKHKGTENLLANLRKRLAKLRELKERRKKKVGKPFFEFKKEGDIMVCFLGVANSGKSYIINKIANSNLESTDVPFETKIPKSIMKLEDGVLFQLVEIPSTFQNEFLQIARISNFNFFILDTSKDIEFQEKIMKDLEEKGIKFEILKNKRSETFEIENSSISADKILKYVWEKLNKIRVFTKPPGKEISERAIVLKKGSKVVDVLREINEELVKKFKFAKIIRNGKTIKVGLDFVLEDKDIIEIRISI